MNNPIYREHILNPPSRKQETLLKIPRHGGSRDLNIPNLLPPENSLFNHKSRESKELLVSLAYTQDLCLQQSKYHEDFLSALTPPDHKQNPLFQQRKSEREKWDCHTIAVFPLAETKSPLEKSLKQKTSAFQHRYHISPKLQTRPAFTTS